MIVIDLYVDGAVGLNGFLGFWGDFHFDLFRVGIFPVLIVSILLFSNLSFSFSLSLSLSWCVLHPKHGTELFISIVGFPK
jgi:hypothetical protein